MKHLQKFSKYLIYITLIGIPLAWWATLYFGVFYTRFWDTNFISIMWHTAWVSLLFVMVIRPLSEIFPRITALKQLVFLRKAFGILSATIVVTNLIASGFIIDDFWKNYVSLIRWEIGYPLLARMSEMTALILLGTSNIYAMKKLGKYWKKIQRLSYLYFISGGLVAGQHEPVWYYGTMGLVLAVYIVHFSKKLYTRKNA